MTSGTPTRLATVWAITAAVLLLVSAGQAAAAGIAVFATGGIGGVHRDSTETGDISADLPAIARYRVTTVTAGAKAFLDLPRRVELMHLLRRLARETESTFLLSTHDLDLALTYANRVVVLYGGQVMADGSPYEVFADDEQLRQWRLLPTSLLKLNREMYAQTGQFLRAEALSQLAG